MLRLAYRVSSKSAGCQFSGRVWTLHVRGLGSVPSTRKRKKNERECKIGGCSSTSRVSAYHMQSPRFNAQHLINAEWWHGPQLTTLGRQKRKSSGGQGDPQPDRNLEARLGHRRPWLKSKQTALTTKEGSLQPSCPGSLVTLSSSSTA